MFYVKRGNVPHKRHTQHRAPDGSLYAEELFGVEGFTGRSSLLYHLVPPTQTHRIEPVATVALEEVDDGFHHHRLIKAAGVPVAGDVVDRAHPAVLQQRRRDGRRPPGRLDARGHLLPQRRGRRDALRPRGRGPAREQLRPAALRPGRLHRHPHRHDLAARAGRRRPSSACSYLECPSEIVAPKRYRNDYGQLLEHSPYSQRDIRAAGRGRRRATDEGEFAVHVKCAAA